MDNEEISLDEFSELPEELKQAARQATREILEKKAKEFEDYLRNSTPVKTGELKGSIVKVTVEDSDNRIAFRVKFDGYKTTNNKKVAYQIIANALNKGYFNNNGVFIAKHIHFIDNCKSLLVGMDELIGERFNVLIGG